MAATATKTDPALWEKVKAKVTAGDKGGKAGQWSARKAQLAVHDYKAAGGGYKGGKAADNHLSQWTGEAWGTKSGEASGETGERYLPKAAREALTGEEYARSTAKKRADTKAGRQFSKQPKDVAGKAARARKEVGARKEIGARKAVGAGGATVAELRKRAAAKGVAGRSGMNKAELERALR